VAGTVGGYFAPDTKNGGWQAAAGVGTWAISRVDDGVKMAEAKGLRDSGANVARTIGEEEVVLGAGGRGTRQWRYAFKDRKLSNWSVPKGAEGTKAAKAVDMARKVGSSKAMTYAGRAGTAVSFGVDAYQQWEKDSHNPSIGTGEKVARAATAGAGSAAGGWAGAEAGAAVGACVGGPVGAVVGGAVGAAIGSGAGKAFAGWVNTKTHGLFH
jgi:surface antigen